MRPYGERNNRNCARLSFRRFGKLTPDTKKQWRRAASRWARQRGKEETRVQFREYFLGYTWAQLEHEGRYGLWATEAQIKKYEQEEIESINSLFYDMLMDELEEERRRDEEWWRTQNQLDAYADEDAAMAESARDLMDDYDGYYDPYYYRGEP